MQNRSEKLYLAQRREARQVRRNKKIFFFAPLRLGGINFLMGLQRREYAIRLHWLNRSTHGGSAAIQIPEPDLCYGFIAEHECDFAAIDARDSGVCAGHGDG
jgi:hypothetical protein